MRTCLSLTIALALLTTSCSKPGPAYRTDATIKEIMDSVVDPNADFVWDSVSVDSTIKGVIEKVPRTDEEWKEVRRHAIALMEATNLLQIPGRRVAHPGEKAEDPRVDLAPEVIQQMIDNDPAAWADFAHGLYDATSDVLKSVDTKNTDKLLEAGDLIDKACESCHLKYWYPRQAEQKDGSAGSMKKK
jgi:hypothetical protein